MALAHLSGGLCYWPGCPEPVLRDTEGMLRRITHIAHIYAAEPGGPRYDETMSDDERRAFENLILLCNPHHGIVDDKANERVYDVETLLRWKEQREADPRQALRRLREVTPEGLRRIVEGGLKEHDAKLLSALGRLEKRDHDAAVLMRSLMDELAEAYSLQRRSLNPDLVVEFGQAVRTLSSMHRTLGEFINAVTSSRRR